MFFRFEQWVESKTRCVEREIGNGIERVGAIPVSGEIGGPTPKSPLLVNDGS
jgi:hypothetical protein